MRIVSFLSMGDLRFGESRRDIRRRLGGKHQAFEKDIGENVTDAYDELGLHLYYDNEDNLEYVEAFAPANPTLDGIEMLGRSSGDVVADLAKAGHMCSSMDNVSLNCDSAGIALYVPDGAIQAVGAFRKGYFNV